MLKETGRIENLVIVGNPCKVKRFSLIKVGPTLLSTEREKAWQPDSRASRASRAIGSMHFTEGFKAAQHTRTRLDPEPPERQAAVSH